MKSSSEVSVRRARLSDSAKMGAVHALCFDYPWPREDMDAHIKSDLCWVCEIARQQGGFLIIRAVGNQAEILTLAVPPKSRRRGYGQALLRAAESDLQNQSVSHLFLDVAEDNPAAIALYRAQGYTPIGRRQAYYRRAGGRVSAIIFEKKF